VGSFRVVPIIVYFSLPTVLRAVESAGQLHPKHSDEYQAYLDTELNKFSMKIFRNSVNMELLLRHTRFTMKF